MISDESRAHHALLLPKISLIHCLALASSEKRGTNLLATTSNLLYARFDSQYEISPLWRQDITWQILGGILAEIVEFFIPSWSRV